MKSKAKPKTEMRRFQLHRDVDESGVSGTGIVSEGIEFTGGKCALTWLTKSLGSVEVCDNIKVVEELHAHGGKTRIIWIDKHEYKKEEE